MINEKDKIVDLNDYKAGSLKEKPVEEEEVEYEPRRRHLRKGAIVCFALLGVLLLLVIIGFLPYYQISEIKVEGNHSLTKNEVITLSGIEEGDSIFFAKTGKAERQIQKSTFVQSVKVNKTFPDQIKINVHEKKSLGYIVTPDGYMQISEDGQLLAIEQTLNDYSLPVISGVKLSKIPAVGGMIEDENLNKALEILKNCDQTLLNNIAELNVANDHNIIAYTNEKIEVRLGGLKNIEQRLQDLDEILNTVVGTRVPLMQVLYIDMRYDGAPVIKLRT